MSNKINEMNKIDELIARHCANGVEFKRLGDVGFFYSGLNGKNKSDFNCGNDEYIPYKNIYKNISVNMDYVDFVKLKPNERQNDVKLGDVLFTGSSENLEECGLSSVLIQNPKRKIYLNSFCFGFRLIENQKLLPDFMKYLFRDKNIRKQIIKTVNGVTRFNISKKSFTKIKIPIPPLTIQKEIVKILDTFTELEKELEKELENRKKQYSYYRDKLLSFEGSEVNWMTLGEVGTLIRGNGLQKKDFTDAGVGCIHYGQIYTYYGTFAYETKSFVSKDLGKFLKKVETGDLIITSTSENHEDICKSVAWLGKETIVTGGHAMIFKHKENSKYLAYYLQTQAFSRQKRIYARGTKVIDISKSDLSKIKIPIPSIEEQNRIVSILDKFESLVNNISIGLPAEINAHRKQYNYYRDKLLTFKERVKPYE